MRKTWLAVPVAALAVAPPWGELRPLYEDLHAHPELSFQEAATAVKLAGRLRALGFAVTTGVGKTGLVGVLENGEGPVVLLRTEMDGLPIEERTGLAFASRATGVSPGGETVPVMHACGHDVHMTAWAGAAAALVADRKSWRGTLVMIGEPAEETGGGAKAMIDDGLLTRFPRPDFALAIHDHDALPAGTAAVRAGPIFASADSVDVVVHGRGGHGARPNMTVDPVVIAARIVLSLQTLVSRENDPFDPAVVTVGSIHGGTKHNIIPDEVRMQLTVRAYKPEVRERLLRGIERIARAEAEAASAPAPPEVTVTSSTPVTVNDPAFAERVGAALRAALGPSRMGEGIQVTAGEDFGRFGEAGIPIVVIWIGASNPEALARARRDGTPLPGLHSALFAPDAEAAVTTGMEALVAAARDAFRRGARGR
ncbi:MAG TPA: amidohydrolase [Candidatus Polarisedimenticolaceae bacterium]|nr:amidohydrolase [Candidatus Polarisedimenticolaceae bacterium]